MSWTCELATEFAVGPGTPASIAGCRSPLRPSSRFTWSTLSRNNTVARMIQRAWRLPAIDATRTKGQIGQALIQTQRRLFRSSILGFTDGRIISKCAMAKFAGGRL